jgi:hypothetical protein
MRPHSAILRAILRCARKCDISRGTARVDVSREIFNVPKGQPSSPRQALGRLFSRAGFMRIPHLAPSLKLPAARGRKGEGACETLACAYAYAPARIRHAVMGRTKGRGKREGEAGGGGRRKGALSRSRRRIKGQIRPVGSIRRSPKAERARR